MPLDVSQVDRSVLLNSQLASVICQVRFDPTPRAGEANMVKQLRERLGGEAAFPKLDQIAEASVNVSIARATAPVAVQDNQTGWRMQSADERQVVILLPVLVTLEVFNYEGWDTFSQRLREVLEAVGELVEPVFEQRLGLRYINQLTVPETRISTDWVGNVDPHFLGIGAHPEIAGDILYARQQALLQLDEEVRCTINHGFAPDDDREGALTYVLDFDLAREGARSFDVPSILDAAATFNTYALRLFQIATTPELRERLNP